MRSVSYTIKIVLTTVQEVVKHFVSQVNRAERLLKGAKLVRQNYHVQVVAKASNNGAMTMDAIVQSANSAV